MTIHDIGTDPLSPAMTITPEQVVHWAREAGFSEWRIGTDENRSGLQMHELRRIERLVNLAHKAGRNVGLAEAAAECGAFNTIEGIAQKCAEAIHERIKA